MPRAPNKQTAVGMESEDTRASAVSTNRMDWCARRQHCLWLNERREWKLGQRREVERKLGQLCSGPMACGLRLGQGILQYS